MGQVNLRTADIAYKMPETAKAGKETAKTSEDFRKLIEERQESGQETVSKETETKTVKEEHTQTSKTQEDTEETLYALYQMNPLLQGTIKPLQTEEMEAVVETEVPFVSEVQEAAAAEETVQILPEGEKPTEMLQGTVKQPETAKTQVQTSETTENHAKETAVFDLKEAADRPQETLYREVTQKSVHTEKTKSVQEEKKPKETREEEPTAALVSQGTVTERTAGRSEVQGNEALTQRMEVKQPEELPQKLAEQLLVKADKGVREFEIQIAPQNLGKIAVKILYENGQTTVSIFCSERKTMELLGQNARAIGSVMEQNLGGTTTIIVDKQETDYLNQQRNDDNQAGREAEQERQREENKKQSADNPEDFLQKLRLGLAG